MKSIFRNTLVKPGAAIALAVAGLLGGGAAQAAGTASGTSITNLATLAYTVGGTTQNPIGSSPGGNSSGAGTTTDFLVDNKVNLTVATVDTSAVSVVPGTTGVATFTVTNNGNSVQDFSLLPGFSLANGTTVFTGVNLVTDNFNPVSCSAFVESAAVANGYQSASDVATFVDELAPDASKTVYVVCPIAVSRIDSDVAAISLTAEALTGGAVGTQGVQLSQTSVANSNAVVDIVFADGAGTDDGVRDAKSSSRDAFKVSSAKLTVTKTVTPVCDPFNGNANNGAKNIPGSYVSYTISIANAVGATTATLGSVTDTLVSSLAFDSDLILINQTLTASPANSTLTAAACKSVATGGTATSGLGNVNIVQTNRSINAFRTSSTSDADGVGLVGSLLTVNLTTTLSAQPGYLAGELKAGESVSVTFQAIIN